MKRAGMTVAGGVDSRGPIPVVHGPLCDQATLDQRGCGGGFDDAGGIGVAGELVAKT